MLIRNLIRVGMAIFLSTLLLVRISYTQKLIVTAAYVDLPNTFVPLQVLRQGFALSGSTGTITVTAPPGVNNYTLVWPGSGGQTGYYVCIGSALGVLTPLAHCPQGSGGGAPLAGFTPSLLQYNSVAVGQTVVDSLLITNTGNATFTFSNPAFTFSGTSGTNFFIPSSPVSTCANSISLDGGASCTLYVSFTPSVRASGIYTGLLSVSDNVAGSPQTIVLSGTGV